MKRIFNNHINLIIIIIILLSQ